MSDNPKSALVVLLPTSWISMLGVGLATTAVSWLFAPRIQLRGHTNNPYIRIVVFSLIPVILVAALIPIALAIFLARRRIERALGKVDGHRPASLHSEARDLLCSNDCN
jgi:hypothetical protein